MSRILIPDAQINSRSAVGWDKKFDLDIWYVDNWSIALDIKILLLTFARLFKREGINTEGIATMPEFMGSGIGKSA